MNRLIVFLLFFVMLGTIPAWTDSTNSGVTTNTQSNTSGSNTAITGGYSAETTTTSHNNLAVFFSVSHGIIANVLGSGFNIKIGRAHV